MQAIANLIRNNSKTQEEIIKRIDAELKKFSSLESETKNDDKKCTLLNFAAQEIKPKIVNFLLRRGAKADAVDSEGRTALQNVCWAGRINNQTEVIEIVGDLLLSGADAFCESSTTTQPLYNAAQSGLVSVVEELLEKQPDVEIGDDSKGSPLCAAAVRGHLDVCRVLLNADANVEGNPFGERVDKMTPLLLACQRGDEKIVKLFLEYEADPATNDTAGNNALHHAAAYGSVGCLKLLLKNATADLRSANNNLETPLDLAIRHLNFDAVQFLLDQSEEIDCMSTFPWLVSRRHMGMLKLVMTHPKMYPLEFRDLCLIVSNDFVDGLEFVLTEIPSLDCSKDELQRLINEFAKSKKVKDLLKERMDNQDDEGNLVRKVKREVLDQIPAGSRRARSPSPKSMKEEKKDTKPKPKNSAAAKKKN